MKKLVFSCFIALFLLACNSSQKNKSIEKNSGITIDWNESDSIRAKCTSPLIPADTFYVKNLVPETSPFQIQKAMDVVAEKGGGTLVVDSGMYASGPIVFSSNIELHLKAGAYITFIPESSLYPLQYTWFTGRPCLNFSSMVYAQNQSNIKLSGQGTLDGQGNHPTWKAMKFTENVDVDLLRNLVDKGLDVDNRKFGKGHSLRPDLMAFYNCQNIAIEGVTLLNTPYFACHPVQCKNVQIRNCTLKSKGYNQIGLAIESSQMVWVDGLLVEDIGEGIKLLSGSVDIENNMPVKDVLIQNCTFRNVSFTPLIFSSKAVKGIERVFVENFSIHNVQDGICMYGQEGSHIQNILIRNIKASNIYGAFFYARILRAQSDKPILENIQMEDIAVNDCGRAMVMIGNEQNQIRNIQVKNAQFQVAKSSLATQVSQLVLLHVKVNNNPIEQTINVGSIELPKINLEGPEEDILDMDDIQYNHLPVAVKNTLDETYPYAPVLDVDRIITSTNASYEIKLELEAFQRVKVLIQSDGALLRKELEVPFTQLPAPVVDQLHRYLGTAATPFILNDIKEIRYRDFTYYQMKGEWNQKLFAIGVSGDGTLIEDKQQNIQFMLPF